MRVTLTAEALWEALKTRDLCASRAHTEDMITRRILAGISALAVGVGLAAAPIANATPTSKALEARAVAAHWTAARMAAAIPRDIVLDERGNSFLADASGNLHPYGEHAQGAPIVVKGKPGGGGSSSKVKNAVYSGGGTMQEAAGRLYFQMWDTGSNAYVGYVCSGTVAKDAESSTGTSLILTAAHCVYDEVRDEFARNVMFIPNQARSGTRTDTVCWNDYYGCWVPTFGGVDADWGTNSWPNNIPYDYGFYVTSNTSGHVDGTAPNIADSLETAVGSLSISWSAPDSGGAYTYALGYSYSDDPKFMYCAQPLGTITSTFTTGTYTNWWLSGCALSGGASGGPWSQPLPDQEFDGYQPIMSVNSWGYKGRPGMAGPKLQDVGSTLGGAHTLYNAMQTLTDGSGNLVGSL